jgi:hypothetical protein
LGIWEAVPFSWAIDYFFHVQDIIAAWDEALPTMFQFDFVSAGVSHKSEMVADVVYDSVRNSADSFKPVIYHDPLFYTVTNANYTRYPVSFAGMLGMMHAPDDYTLGWNKGKRQASYLASVAYLLASKR